MNDFHRAIFLKFGVTMPKYDRRYKFKNIEPFSKYSVVLVQSAPRFSYTWYAHLCRSAFQAYTECDTLDCGGISISVCNRYRRINGMLSTLLAHIIYLIHDCRTTDVLWLYRPNTTTFHVFNRVVYAQPSVIICHRI